MSIQEIKCPHCGNSDINRIQHCTTFPSSYYRRLTREEDGSIWADDYVNDVVEDLEALSKKLFCESCVKYFPDPGIQIE